MESQQQSWIEAETYTTWSYVDRFGWLPTAVDACSYPTGKENHPLNRSGYKLEFQWQINDYAELAKFFDVEDVGNRQLDLVVPNNGPVRRKSVWYAAKTASKKTASYATDC